MPDLQPGYNLIPMPGKVVVIPGRVQARTRNLARQLDDYLGITDPALRAGPE
jgi:hypothetical protein